MELLPKHNYWNRDWHKIIWYEFLHNW